MLLMATSALVLPIQPLMVTTVHTGLMEVACILMYNFLVNGDCRCFCIIALSALVTYSRAAYSFQGKEKCLRYRGKRAPFSYGNN